ncbi:hypothetical protein Trydic_g19817 [Trypoxylus dichotomus]
MVFCTRADVNCVPLLQPGQAAREDEELETHETMSWPAFMGHLSTNGDRRPVRAQNSSTPRHRSRNGQSEIRNQHLACCRRQSLRPQGSPRLDTVEEQAPKTVVENAQPGSQSGLQSNGETNQGRTGRIP